MIIISISKIKKIIAILKNRREKGDRGINKQSNPHSKEEFFSLSWKDFFVIIIISINIINKIIKVKYKNFIILFKLKFFNWKLNVIIYTNKIENSSINKCV